MACNLGPDFLCSSITSFRSAEDFLIIVISAFIMFSLYISIKKIVKEGPLVKRLYFLMLSFIPVILWKVFGWATRVFMQKTNPMYKLVAEFSEIMEGLSAIFIFAAMVYLFMMIKPKKKK